MKNKKRILYFLIFIIVVIAGLLLINILTGNKLINNLYTGIGKKIGETEISYKVYDNSDMNNIKVVVYVSNDTGIDYIEKTEENAKIKVYGRKNIALDYTTEIDKEITLKTKAVDGDVKESRIKITQEYIDNLFNIEELSSNDEYTNLEMQYTQEKESTDKIYYRLKKLSWQEYRNLIKLVGKVYLEKPADTTNLQTAKIYLKKEDQNKNTIYVDKTVYYYDDKTYYNEPTALSTILSDLNISKSQFGFSCGGSEADDRTDAIIYRHGAGNRGERTLSLMNCPIGLDNITVKFGLYSSGGLWTTFRLYGDKTPGGKEILLAEKTIQRGGVYEEYSFTVDIPDDIQYLTFWVGAGYNYTNGPWENVFSFIVNNSSSRIKVVI